MAATINGPQLVQITKKTANNTYTLYYPQTDSSYVLHLASHPLDPDFSDLLRYDAKGNVDQSGSYFHVNDLLNVIFDKISSISHVLEFKGVKSTYADLGQASVNTVGDVYVVNEAHDTYPAGTLYVGSADNTTSPVTYSWQPLGGNNTVYATKAEALSSVSLNGPTLSFAYADNSTQNTHITSVTFSTIGTAAASTVGIVTTIPESGSDNSIPNVAAVRDFAGSAGKLNTTTATTDTSYYIVAVDSNTGDVNQTPYDMGLEIKKYATTTQKGAAGWINVQVQEANRLTNGLQIGSIWYDGENAVTVFAGAGITIGAGANAATISLSASGVVSGTYSAVQVDTYGRATAGAQSIVFANSFDDPDLNQLVVGGLAFVSSSETAKPSGTVSTNSIDLNN